MTKNNLIPLCPRLLLTMGEPAGIGPELLVRIAQLSFDAQLVALADPQLLQDIAGRLQLPLILTEFVVGQTPERHQPGRLFLVPVKMPRQVNTGKLDPENAPETIKMLGMASELALSKAVDAIVTGPVHKANLNAVNPDFMGHTEFFAAAAGCGQVVMMLASGQLRICLATTHLPLTKVPSAITEERLTQTIEIILQAFSRINLPEPRIAVCGLNPHAGEDGLLGNEDKQIIKPVIQRFATKGHAVYGPFPADTLFTPQKRQAFDVFLAMYHDQGLPVVKAFGFGQCANVTLGLPYIRTSVDHGTALDIAATYRASPDSLVYAINYAIQLASGQLPQ